MNMRRRRGKNNTEVKSMDKNGKELPTGLRMALAQDPKAMRYFASLTPMQQERVITQIHTIGSKQEIYGKAWRCFAAVHITPFSCAE